MSDYVSYYQSPIGLIEVRGTAEVITSVLFAEEIPANRHDVEPVPEVITSCIQQIEEYFQGERSKFTLPLQTQGTAFQNQVWNHIATISIGETISYKNLATLIENPAAVRAVGSATGKNRFAILVPCHRVIGSREGLHGYAWEVWRKEWLLNHENEIRPR